MNKSGPIILVDDDQEECELVSYAYTELELRNELLCFPDGQKVIAYLEGKGEIPFLILSDVHMPIMGGLELLERLGSEPALRAKSVPFIFLSTTASPGEIRSAYELKAQGVFEKGRTVEEIKASLASIITYWKECKYPEEEQVG